MSRDLADLLKVLVVTLLVFALGTLLMHYVIHVFTQYGGGLPVIGDLPIKAPPEMVPMLTGTRLFTTLAAVHVTALGLALLVTSHTIDIALLITSKAVAVALTALLGCVGGQMAYAQLTTGNSFSLTPLTPVAIILVAFLVLSSVLSVQNLRQLGNLRFAVAVAFILIGPMLMAWL